MKKITFNSPVILTFLFLSFAALVINNLTAGAANDLVFSVYHTSFTDPMQYVRLVTHVLGHADMMHFASNMMIFLLVGPLLEEKYGSERILQVILITSVVTGLVHILLSDNSALMGASGIDFAFILMAGVTGNKKGIPPTMLLAAVLYIGTELYNGVFALDDIAHFTHILGGCIGGMCGLALHGQ